MVEKAAGKIKQAKRLESTKSLLEVLMLNSVVREDLTGRWCLRCISAGDEGMSHMPRRSKVCQEKRSQGEKDRSDTSVHRRNKGPGAGGESKA